MFRKLTIFLLLTLAFLAGSGQRLMAQRDSICVSLLTCSPGQEVYSLYGHTALRCRQTAGELDLVFNYGVFDMRKPHFVWNFILGRTDYVVEPLPWKYFTPEYEERGSGIVEQELNLTNFEATKLMGLLRENCLPENRGYRYNYLTKNCTTMVRDMIERAVGGHILYPDTLPHQTARQILHRYTEDHPWAQEGNDLLLGADVDTVMSARASLFIPANLMQAFDGALIVDASGNQRPLVKSKAQPLMPRPEAQSRSQQKLPSPYAAMLILAAVCIIVALLEAWTKRHFWLFDVLILLLQGAAGLLLAFMFFFSEHPAVGSNWQLWLLNPVALIGIPFVIKAATRHKHTLWYTFYFIFLALFLLFSPWIPQVFAKITVPLALCLLTRPVSYHYFRSRKEKNDRK